MRNKAPSPLPSSGLSFSWFSLPPPSQWCRGTGNRACVDAFFLGPNGWEADPMMLPCSKEGQKQVRGGDASHLFSLRRLRGNLACMNTWWEGTKMEAVSFHQCQWWDKRQWAKNSHIQSFIWRQENTVLLWGEPSRVTAHAEMFWSLHLGCTQESDGQNYKQCPQADPPLSRRLGLYNFES